MRAFALSSAVAGCPLTALHAMAFERSLRRLERWWSDDFANCPTWENLANVGMSWSPDVGAIPEDPEASVVQLVEQLPDARAAAAGDVAYHTVDGAGRPISYVLCSDAWSVAMMHEIHESRVNPLCGREVTTPGGVRTLVEVCDWVQGSDYEEVGCAGITLANAVGPGFFRAGTIRPEGLDIASDLRAPSVTSSFQLLRGGYYEDLDHAGNVYGSDVPAAARDRLDRTGARGGLARRLRFTPSADECEQWRRIYREAYDAGERGLAALRGADVAMARKRGYQP